MATDMSTMDTDVSRHSRPVRRLHKAVVVVVIAAFCGALPGQADAAGRSADSVAAGQADVAVTDSNMSCVSRSSVGNRFDCWSSTTVTNLAGGPTTAVVTFDVGATVTDEYMTTPETPAECVATVNTPAPARVTLAVGEEVRLHPTWTITCRELGFHLLHLTVEAQPVDPLTTDLDPGNNKATARGDVTLYDAILRATVESVRCSQRGPARKAKGNVCEAIIDVTNEQGPTTPVRAVMSIQGWSGSCTVTPVADVNLTLAAGQTVRVTRSVRTHCAPPLSHSVAVYAGLRTAPGDPLVIYSEGQSRFHEGVLVWTPLVVKNMPTAWRRGSGTVSFAILGTPEIPISSLYPDAITFGATGTERSVQQCRSDRDVNGDGDIDLVCDASVPLTGLTCRSREARMRTYIDRWADVVGQDAIKLVGCNRGRAT